MENGNIVQKAINYFYFKSLNFFRKHFNGSVLKNKLLVHNIHRTNNTLHAKIFEIFRWKPTIFLTLVSRRRIYNKIIDKMCR